jgi:transcriptional regulator with XRE-family HTH domain
MGFMDIVVRNQEGREGFRLRLEARLKNAALVKARENLGLTQKEVAKRIGVCYNQYSGFENLRLYPSQRLKKMICDFYTLNGQDLDEHTIFPIEICKRKFARRYVAERTIAPENLVALSEVEENMLPPADSDFENMLERDENVYRIEQIKKVLPRLSKYQQQVIQMHYGFDGSPKSFEQIALELNREIHSVRNSLRNAEINLRRFLRNKGVC